MATKVGREAKVRTAAPETAAQHCTQDGQNSGGTGAGGRDGGGSGSGGNGNGETFDPAHTQSVIAAIRGDVRTEREKQQAGERELAEVKEAQAVLQAALDADKGDHDGVGAVPAHEPPRRRGSVTQLHLQGESGAVCTSTVTLSARGSRSASTGVT